MPSCALWPGHGSKQLFGRETLFRSVIERSATQVADAQGEIIARHLDAVDHLEADLIAFCLVWATPTPEFSEYFALVRQINAEVAHIPTATLDSWQATGPLRVRRELAVRMRHLAERGLIHAPDPALAASHLILLTATEVANRTHLAATPPSFVEVTRLVTAGVHTFLHGHKRTA